MKKQSRKHLFELIPTARQTYITRHINSIPLLKVKHYHFKKFFFPSTRIEWNNLASNKRNSESLKFFKKLILSFIRPSTNSSLHYHNPKGLTLITRLMVVSGHLRFHKFKHSFQDILNPV